MQETTIRRCQIRHSPVVSSTVWLRSGSCREAVAVIPPVVGRPCGILWAMLTRIDLRGVADVRAVLPRPAIADEGPVAAVREILAAVKARGDDALR